MKRYLPLFFINLVIFLSLSSSVDAASIKINDAGLSSAEKVQREFTGSKTSQGGNQNLSDRKGKVNQKRFKKLSRKKELLLKAALVMPSGKLLTAIIFLIASVVIFAIGGVVEFGALFGILGSAFIILSLVFFILWLSERANTSSKSNG